jgi:hypothetical protein
VSKAHHALDQDPLAVSLIETIAEILDEALAVIRFKAGGRSEDARQEIAKDLADSPRIENAK